jgi:hypothetical protein
MFQRSLPTLLALTTITLSMAAQSNSVSVVPSDQHAAWQTAITARRKELVDKNGPGTDKALQDELLKMRDQDQAARGFATGSQPSVITKEMQQKMPEVDAQLTQELKQIVAQKSWPTIALVGIDASNAAMVVLTHTTDHAWQLQLLPQLQALAAADKIDASSFALVVDKELISEGKLQRYGSQFRFFNGGLAMYAVEQPVELDERRAKALLPPIQVYKQTLEQLYHLKATDEVVMATKSAGK